jgi:hypothetical protein
MALVAVPVSVLSRIRKLIFDFLWSGGGKVHGLHLCNWEILAKPKHLGGWGLRNLFIFQPCLGCKLLMACFDERWDLAPGDKRQISTLLLSGHLAQNDYGYSTFGLTDLEKLDEIVASHYTLDKLETW